MNVRKHLLAAFITVMLVGYSSVVAEDHEHAYVIYASLSDPLKAVTEANLVSAKFGIQPSVLEYVRDYKSFYRVASRNLPYVKALVLMQDARAGGYKDAWVLRADDEIPVFFSLGSDTTPTPRTTETISSAEESDISTTPVTPSSDLLSRPIETRRPPIRVTPIERLEGFESLSPEDEEEVETRPSLWQLDPDAPTPEPSSETQSNSTTQSGLITPSNIAQTGTPTDRNLDVAQESSSVEDTTTGATVNPGSAMRIQQFNDATVNIDGALDDAIWHQVNEIDTMYVIYPPTLDTPHHHTTVRMFSTKEGLYVAAAMDQPAETLVRRLSARDKSLNRDSFELTLDTSGEGLFGFWFAVNLGGTKADGKIVPEWTTSDQWDGAWFGESAVTPNGWSAEMYIPWSIVTMPKVSGSRQMSYFVGRQVAYRNERYGWPGLSYNQPKFMSALQPMDLGDVHPKQHWEIYPYVASSDNAITGNQDSTLGMSFSWRPSGNLQLTGTVNPEFGAVESDDVVVNLTAYETFFPEKRLFFVEGSEVFVTSPRSSVRRSSSRSDGARSPPSTYRMEPTTLLNTRRIGGAAQHVDVPDHVDVEGTEYSKPTDLLAALKLVGQSDAWRYGLLAASEAEPELYGKDKNTGESVTVTGKNRNFAVGRWLYERTGEGRTGIGYMGTVADYPSYNAFVHGIDAHYLSPKGISIDSQFIASSKEDTDGYGAFADMTWFDKNARAHNLSFNYFDDKLDISDLGFLRRNDIRGFEYFSFRRTDENLPLGARQKRLNFFSSAQFNGDGDLIMAWLGSGLSFEFVDLSEFQMQFSWRPTMVDDYLSRDHGYFKTRSGNYAKFSYATDSAKKFSYSLQTGFRDGPTGRPAHFSDAGFTFTPVSEFSLDYDFRYGSNEAQLIHVGDGLFETYETEEVQHILSTDLFLNARQQFRFTFHWIGIKGDVNGFYQLPIGVAPLVVRPQPAADFGEVFPISRLTAQIRYRWEIAPLSDLFVVYTRGSNLYLDVFEDFETLMDRAINEPVVDVLVVKLRYRFGG